MASITIRNLDDTLMAQLRIRAALHGRSLEEEARDILRTSLPDEQKIFLDLYTLIRQIIEPVGGVELEPLSRAPARESKRLRR